MSNDLTRPIIGIENRTAEEVFDIMADRIRYARPSPAAGVEIPEGYALVPIEPTEAMLEAAVGSAEHARHDYRAMLDEALRAAQVRGSGS